ncbi:DUF551 domain-containing protein [Massilia oculi]|uniref:DUF551 domain-containing protein n=1 Tax=Massilia oculi TaxID=945844 RepID=A0A2S2DG06_9BURK|nr:DUF551 domain-containing protein [Massilia oculi]AWL04262.1 hypothetical protein DIR46_07325 [Massilia oculi]
MNQVITRATGATPSATPPATARRTWAILLTSANHGVVGPLGSTFPHAGEHHERVQVVELVEAGAPPAPDVDLAGLLRFNMAGEPVAIEGAAPVAAQAGQVAAADLHDAIIRLRETSPYDPVRHSTEHVAYKCGHRDARHAAAELATGSTAGQVAVPGWISVDERFPGEQGQDSEEVLCFLSGHCAMTDFECRDGAGWGIRLGYYDAEKGMFRTGGRPDASVTHWMPLPPSPAKESK